MKEYPEVHQQGMISIENAKILPFGIKEIEKTFMKGDLGVQIASDGRIWMKKKYFLLVKRCCQRFEVS